jgi:hypothetical protein
MIDADRNDRPAATPSSPLMVLAPERWLSKREDLEIARQRVWGSRPGRLA